MTQSERIEIIRQMANSSNAMQVSPAMSSFIEDLKAEILAEELIVQHGLLDAQKSDVEDEISQLESQDNRADEEEDFDSDENLRDMKAVSPLMREIFGE
jgi:hypothetical protein